LKRHRFEPKIAQNSITKIKDNGNTAMILEASKNDWPY
jgi:hypothetical protein